MAGLDGKKLKQVIDPVVAKAFTHPLRGHVWMTLCERGMASPTEIANELDIDVSEVSYHFRNLQKKKLIGLAGTIQRRGFDEHFYEPTAPAIDFDDTEWMKLPVGIRASFSGEMLQQIIEALTGAVEAGSFDARNRHLSQTWISVDEQGWKELMRTARQALDRILAIQAKCAERRKGSTEPGIPVSVVMASFQTAASMSAPEADRTEEL